MRLLFLRQAPRSLLGAGDAGGGGPGLFGGGGLDAVGRDLSFEGFEFSFAAQRSREAELVLVVEAEAEVFKVRLQRDGIAEADPVGVAAGGIGDLGEKILAGVVLVLAAIQ